MRMMYKGSLFIVILIFLCSVLMVSANEGYEEPQRNELIRAKIIDVVSDETDELEGGFSIRTQKLKLKILEGIHKNEVISGENVVSQQMGYEIIVNEGDQVLLMLEEDGQNNIANAYVSELVRDNFLKWLVLIFILLMILVGGFKGVKSLITLSIIALSIFKFLIPRILAGGNPLILTIITSFFVTIVTLLIIGGFNKKIVAAIIGTIGGVICAGIIAHVFSNLASLSGLSMEESQFLLFLPQEVEFDFRGLLLSGIILGALGAVMDVSMSIASSINEINQANPVIPLKQLFKSGMNIGKDIMGTMSNTLILAYAATSMNLIIIIMAYEIPFKEIINRDIIASEIVRGLAGTIGLIFTIPITAIIAAVLYKTKEVNGD